MIAKERIQKRIDEKISSIDTVFGLVSAFRRPNYHSNLKDGTYCFIHDSVKVAAAVFSCGYEKHYDLAQTLLKKAISFQCETGENAGLWPYFAEEPIEKMVAPDHNYVDFNAYPMLYILKEHKNKLSDETREAIKEACILACEAITRRNVSILYTNPTVMGIYCTAVCGELFGIDKFLTYAKRKLKQFYLRIMSNGTYDEYNCPGYSLLIADLYSLMLRHIEDREMHRQTEELNALVWQMLGEHYHAGLMEFTGPNARQYDNFTKKDDLPGIAAGGEKADLLTLVFDTKCPDGLTDLFTQKEKNADFRRLVSKGYLYPYLGYPMVDTQWIRPGFTLGSFSMNDCWNQRRNVVAYIGNKDKKVCIRLRTYHDGYDFCSAFTSTAQEGNTALSLTNFHTDRGDTHVDLDPVKDATIRAKDLSVLYQIEANGDGIIEEIKTQKTENGYRLEIFGTKVEISFPYIEATDLHPRIEISRAEKELLIKAVLYAGTEKKINLKFVKSLAVVSVLTVGGETENEVQIGREEEILTADLKVGNRKLTVKGPYQPLKQAHSVLLNEVLIDGENIIKVQEEEG